MTDDAPQDSTTTPRAELPVRHIFRWDLDKTYLRTEFDSVRDLIRTALLRPEERLNVPGADALLRQVSRPHPDGRVLLTFISGSPTQMRKKLEQKFALDGIKPDAFILKDQLGLLVRGKWRALRGQVGYKLDALLRVRADAPNAPESLFGDDAEQDAFIYSLYGDLATGLIDLTQLEAILTAARVYHDTAEAIMARADAIERHGNVQRIFIHLDRKSPPGRFMVFGPRVVPIINYFQASLTLFADQVLDASDLMQIAADMVRSASYDVVQLGNSFQDLARRGHISRAAVDRLLDARDSIHQLEHVPDGFADKLLSRLRALAPRNDSPRPDWQGPPNYIEVLRHDHSLRESIQKEQRGGLFS